MTMCNKRQNIARQSYVENFTVVFLGRRTFFSITQRKADNSLTGRGNSVFKLYYTVPALRTMRIMMPSANSVFFQCFAEMIWWSLPDGKYMRKSTNGIATST